MAMKKILLFISAICISIDMLAGFSADKYYSIHRNGNSNGYIYASGDNMGVGGRIANNALYLWRLIPTGNEDCYYIQNVMTGLYVQTSNITLSSLVALGEEPVEYVVSTGAGTDTYFLCSNDQGKIDYSKDATLGLNMGSQGVLAYYIKTGRGNSYWEIAEESYTPEERPEPKPEEEDACKNVVAYRIPCGSYSSLTRLTKVDIEGEGVMTELHYSPKSSTSFNLYVTERATVAKGGKVVVSADLVGSTVAGLAVSVWADFDGDGQFEQSVTPAIGSTIEAELTVPEDVAGLKGRIRIRVDQDANIGANADFYGAIYDFPVNIADGDSMRTLSVRSCSEGRGLLIIQGQQGYSARFARGTQVKVCAEAYPGYTFTGWRQGRTIVSTDQVYSTTMTENKELVALFSVDKYSRTTQDRLLLSFSSTHSDSPIVSVRDAGNNVVSDVQASIVSVVPAQKTENAEGSVVMAQTDITPNTNQKEQRSATFCVNGIPDDFYLESMKVSIAATVGNGDYAKSSELSQFFNLKLYTGPTPETLTLFAEVDNQNINKKPGQTLSWTMKRTEGSMYPTDPLYIRLEFDPQDDGGLYSTLKSIDILKSKTTPVDDIIQLHTESAVTDADILYDLSGRRVTSPTSKGIFITQSGKKVLR